MITPNACPTGCAIHDCLACGAAHHHIDGPHACPTCGATVSDPGLLTVRVSLDYHTSAREERTTDKPEADHIDAAMAWYRATA